MGGEKIQRMRMKRGEKMGGSFHSHRMLACVSYTSEVRFEGQRMIIVKRDEVERRWRREEVKAFWSRRNESLKRIKGRV